MNRHHLKRTILFADGAGCAIAGLAMLAGKRHLPAGDPLARQRVPLVFALFGTSAALVSSSVHCRDRDLERSASVNALWVAWCAVNYRKCRTCTTRSLVGVTGILDLTMGVIQMAVRRG